MSPILVRPVREQLEHDRLIRQLQVRNRRKHDVGINPGNEQNAAVAGGTSTLFPDLVLSSLARGKRLEAVVEVETGESVNHLEALAEWAHFARLRAAFHLYVPSSMIDVARRLCEHNRIHVNEIWSYHAMGEDVRFTLVHRNRDPGPSARSRGATPGPAPVKRKSPPKRAARRKSPPRAKGRKKPARSPKRK